MILTGPLERIARVENNSNNSRVTVTITVGNNTVVENNCNNSGGIPVSSV